MKTKSPIVEIAKKACPAVITIIISKDLPKIDGFYYLPYGDKNFLVPQLNKGKNEKTRIGGGSGFLVSQDGYVLTNQHVVSDPDADYMVILDPGRKFSAKIIARDRINDVAILKIDEKNLPHLLLGDSDKIDLGESVVAIGNPMGEFHDTLSAGIVSGLSRLITAHNGPSMEMSKLKGLIQTDAAINPGNSGGPLVDMEGKVIGINTAIVEGAQNLGFAIPINYAKRDLEEVKKFGRIKRPFLGVKYIVLDAKIAEEHHLPVGYGAIIIRERFGEDAVVKGSAAERAGLTEFDIILEVEGEKVNNGNPLASALAKYDIGDEIELKVLRSGKEFAVKVKLEEKR